MVSSFKVRGTRVKFTCANIREATFERAHVNVKVKQRSTFTFTRDLPYMTSISCTQ